MGKVRLLPDRVANQIAAGEVIERPAAVIKELVENALDAGATRVEVEFRHGGRSLMRVEDNGCGMSRDDALLAIERHATSKIREADDLNRLMSFGFRGEALPSIASVSKFELQTREVGSDVGTEILVNGGKLLHVRECGRPVGTRIEVTHLFNSVPARRKFLKSDTTESAHIIQAVRLYALAFPQVSFSLLEDGRILFRSPQCRTLPERITEIFGRQVADGLVAIECGSEGMSLSGLIGPPGVGRGTRHEMITFINRRPVDSRTLNYALIESYHESLPKGRYPVAFVFFEIDPAAVDVNVHPSKREVRFRSEPAVRGFVIRSILERLRQLGGLAAPTAVTTQLIPDALPAARPAFLSPERPMAFDRIGIESLRPVWPSPSPTRESPSAEGLPPASSAPLAVPAATPSAPPPVPASSPLGVNSASTVRHWRFLGVAHGSHALFETPAGVVLLDRKAAHERVWFERIRKQFRSGSVPSQRLLLPVPVELDPVATALLLDRLTFFETHGFEICEFGRQCFRIEAVPAWMEPLDAEHFVRDLLGALREGRLQDRDVDVARDELARLAAAQAVRLPPAPSETELKAAVAALFACETPLTSPAGRPTFIELSHGEIARRFQRGT